MQEFLLETKTGRSVRWLALLVLLAVPLTPIVSQLYSEITRERGVFGSEAATPIEQKTPLGRILQALDTKKDIHASRAIFEQEKNQLPQDVQDYLNKFYDFYDYYSSGKFDSLVNLSPYEHLITGAVYIIKDMDDKNTDSRSYYRAFEVIPFTFMKMVYKAHVMGGPTREQVLDLCNQYQKSIVEPQDNISGRGATIFCIIIRLEYLHAMGDKFKRDKKGSIKTNPVTNRSLQRKIPQLTGRKREFESPHLFSRLIQNICRIDHKRGYLG